ncbi:MAG: NAD(P)-dependent oxidoreductase [Myxococcota bacterium]|nr:NAD(P)-dependent oxidoreductase [Myxococcota bacterium]
MALTPRRLRGPFQRALVLEEPDASLDGLLRSSGIEPVRIDRTPEKAELLALLREHRPHLLFKRSRLTLDEEILDAAEDLFAVMLCCIGDDSVDKQAAADRGILILNDPRSNGRSVAEMVMSHLIVGSRRLPGAWAETREHRWAKSASGRFEIKGKRLGILGLGNIGKMVARMAENFGMEVLFHDTDEVAVAVGETMEWESVDSPGELFAQSDLVTVHVSAEDGRGRSNRGVLSLEQLMELGKDRPEDSPRVLVNLARGFVFDPAHLKEAIAAGVVRQAFVDVYPDEPQVGALGWDNPYADEPAVFCTPHIGAATRDAQPRIAKKMARTARLLSGKGTVEDCVFAPRHRIDVATSAESPHILAVVHSDERGTKKAVDDVIFAAGINNLQSSHRDFPRYGIAYDLSVLERPLDAAEIDSLVVEAAKITGRDDAIRAVRQVSCS